MGYTFDNPFVVLSVFLVAQWFAAFVGDLLGRSKRLKAEEQEDFAVLRTATLTLLALLIGFGFSMAVSRYDQRKDYEAAEANAIGTEYGRADMLPTQDTVKVRSLLLQYANLRVAFYEAGDERQIGEIGAHTTKIQAELWSLVAHAAAAQPTPLVALAVSGMNDVLNSQRRTQAAWWNRIPVAAWWLLGLIAIACNVLIGYGERQSSALVLLILPIVVSISFFLIADIDSPRGGVIRVLPQNLIAVYQFMNPQ